MSVIYETPDAKEQGGYLPLFGTADATSHVGLNMTADDDVPAQRDILKLSLSVTGLVWYTILCSLGLLGCWTA